MNEWTVPGRKNGKDLENVFFFFFLDGVGGGVWFFLSCVVLIFIYLCGHN